MRCAAGLVALAMALSTAEITAAGAGLDPDGASNELHTQIATLKSQNLAQGAALSAVKAAIPAKQLASIMTAVVVERCPGDSPASVLEGHTADRCTTSPLKAKEGNADGPAKQLALGEERGGYGSYGSYGGSSSSSMKLKPGSAALKAWRVRGGDFSQCKSEGGHALCPVCDFEGGAMPCQESRGRNAQRGGDPKLYASNCRTEDGNNLFVHPNSNRVYCFRKFGGNARWNKEQWTNVFLVGVHGKEKDALRPYGAIWITKSFVGKMDKACSRSLADPNAVR